MLTTTLFSGIIHAFSLPSGVHLTSGWTKSLPGESCSSACERTGKGSCEVERMNEITSQAAFEAANLALMSFGLNKTAGLDAFACGADPTDFAGEAMKTAPFRYVGEGKKCRFQDPAGALSTCEASQGGIYAVERICCCITTTAEDRTASPGANVTSRCPLSELDCAPGSLWDDESSACWDLSYCPPGRWSAPPVPPKVVGQCAKVRPPSLFPFWNSISLPRFRPSSKLLPLTKALLSLSLSLSLLLFLLPPVLSGALRPRVTPRPPRKSSVHRNVRRGEVRCYRRPLLRRFRLRRVPFWALLQHECDRMPRDYGLDVWSARQVVHGVMREAWPHLHL